MKRRKGNSSNPLMSREDRHLWKRVADTTTPLTQKRGQLLKDEMARLMENSSLLSPVPIVKQPKLNFASYHPPEAPPINFTTHSQTSHPIEDRIAHKLAKGRQSIDSRIDLHGMTQDRARFALLDYLQMAQRADHRIVLVITGKGNEGQGVLRRAVPDWLHLPVFQSLVNGFRASHISHGGEGALYVRIRKPSGRDKKGGIAR